MISEKSQMLALMVIREVANLVEPEAGQGERPVSTFLFVLTLLQAQCLNNPLKAQFDGLFAIIVQVVPPRPSLLRQLLRREDPPAITTVGPLRLCAPRIDDGAVTASYPLTPERLRRWRGASICVHGRPEWIFIKLYCHGFFTNDQAATIGERARIHTMSTKVIQPEAYRRLGDAR